MISLKMLLVYDRFLNLYNNIIVGKEERWKIYQF